jgi:hypothetical protein
MNYTKDTTRLTVLVVAFLLVGSAFTFLPAFASTGNAATSTAISSPMQNASPPQVVGAPDVIQEGTTATGVQFAVQVTNPSSNAYAIVSLSVLAPSGWTFSDHPQCGSSLPTVGATSSTAVQCTIPSGGSGLPPGFTTTLDLGDITGPAESASAAPTVGTFTTLVVDASSATSYAGSSFSEWSIYTVTSLTVTTSATSFTAGGSALTITSTLNTGQSGVPLTWNFSNPNYPSSGYTASLSPPSATTSSSGATTSFTPSNHATDTTDIDVWIGNGLFVNVSAEQSVTHNASPGIETFAGSPSEVSFYFTSPPSNGTVYSSDYLVNPISVSGTLYAEAGTGVQNELTMALSDAYANPVGLSSAITSITLSSSGGYFYYSNGTLATSLVCGASDGDLTTAYCQSGYSYASGQPGVIQFPIPTGDVTGHGQSINYIQSSVYGAVGALSGVIVSAGSSYTGSSGNIVTSTLVSSLPTPGVPTADGAISTADSNVSAGSSISIADYVIADSLGQEGVPITVNLCTSCSGTSTGYNADFSDGAESITLYTNSSGWVQTSMPANVTLSSVAIFNATALYPLITSTTNTLSSANGGTVTTQVGSIATLVVNVASGTDTKAGPNIAYSVASGTAYVDVAYADAYGNLIPAPGPDNQIQIGLSATNGGLLSATNVYIAALQVSTNGSGSFGSIELTMPSAVGTAVVLTATGVVSGASVSGTATVTVVSASPTINVTAPVPVSGYLYANATEVTFKGIANATAGNESTTISTIGYEVGTSGWESVATPALHNVTWAIPVVLAAGLNTVTFNDTDSNSVTTVLPAYTVLVDTSAPVLTTPTLVNGTNTATLNATSAEGDLNASAVQAWANGTALPSSDITVTGTNNPGSSVNYTISVANLPAGTWTLEVTAWTLAGDSASASGTVTVTVTTSLNAFTVATPTGCTLGSYNAVCVPVTNTQAGALTGVVFAVVQNSSGQTVEVATATVSALAGTTSTTAYVVVSVPAGSYTVNAFVWSTSGSPISAPQSGISITVA